MTNNNYLSFWSLLDLQACETIGKLVKLVLKQCLQGHYLTVLFSEVSISFFNPYNYWIKLLESQNFFTKNIYQTIKMGEAFAMSHPFGTIISSKCWILSLNIAY